MSLKISELEADIELQLIQELIPLGLMHIREVLKVEVKHFARDRYRRNKIAGHIRWSEQLASVCIKKS